MILTESRSNKTFFNVEVLKYYVDILFNYYRSKFKPILFCIIYSTIKLKEMKKKHYQKFQVTVNKKCALGNTKLQNEKKIVKIISNT